MYFLQNCANQFTWIYNTINNIVQKKAYRTERRQNEYNSFIYKWINQILPNLYQLYTLTDFATEKLWVKEFLFQVCNKNKNNQTN